MRRRITILSNSDVARLLGLIDSSKRAVTRDRDLVENLEEKLSCSEVVPDYRMPRNVVRMNSLARIRDLDVSATLEYILVFPKDADITEGRISVLAPLGTAMLGQWVGDEIEWVAPGGLRRIKVEDVHFQPREVRTAA